MYLVRNYCDSDQEFSGPTPKICTVEGTRNAYGERMTEAREQQLEKRLTKLCQF